MANPSQAFVDIKEIRDGVIVLRDGGLRGVLLTSSVNISLKSADEQQAIMSQFQNFLNTLEFPIQITMQSRRLDIQPYLLTLEDRLEKQEEELLRIQTKEYIEFIRLFTDQVNIMTKNFFVVVPYEGAASDGSKKRFGLFGKKKTRAEQTAGITEAFEQKRSQLEQRMSVVSQGLTRLGVRVENLSTEQLIELFHNVYNPGDTYREATMNKMGASKN